MIDPPRYKLVSDNIATLATEDYFIQSDFYNSSVLLGKMISTIDMIASDPGFYRQYTIFLDIIDDSSMPRNMKDTIDSTGVDGKIYSTTYILDAVSALQTHIITYYGPVNDFLSNNSIKVKQTFANLSYYIGVYILPSNIES